MASITLGFLPPQSTTSPSSTLLQKKQSSTTIFSNTHLHSNHSFIFSASNSITPSFPSSSSRLSSRRWAPSFAASEFSEPEAPSLVDSEPNSEPTEGVETDSEPEPVPTPTVEANLMPKGEEVFAVVMIGSRQYIVFPGRFLYTQRLKDANVNDKIVLNKVLLVGTKTKTYIGKPVVENAAVHAVVEEQGLNKKVIVFKYKKKKNYRRNIGHRQPNTRIRITGVTGYQDFPAAELAATT